MEALRKEVEDSFYECSRVDPVPKREKTKGHIKTLSEDLGANFTMQKLRKLE